MAAVLAVDLAVAVASAGTPTLVAAAAGYC